MASLEQPVLETPWGDGIRTGLSFHPFPVVTGNTKTGNYTLLYKYLRLSKSEMSIFKIPHKSSCYDMNNFGIKELFGTKTSKYKYYFSVVLQHHC